MPDNVGNKDVFAIVVTKQAIDWYAVNNAITKSAGNSYADKVAAALDQNGVGNVRFCNRLGRHHQFRVNDAQQNAVICVVEVNK